METHKINLAAGLFLSFIVLVLIFYYPTVWSIGLEWLHSDTYSHGLLLFPVCILLVYFYWKQNGENIKLAVSWTAIILVGLTSLTWFAASLGNVQVLQQLALTGLIILIPWSLFGYRQARGLIPFLALIVLAIPVWDFLGIYLQLITASVVNVLLNMFGITAIREGLHIQIPAGLFEVADSCSGLRQLIVAIIIAVLFVFRYRLRMIPGLIFILLSIIVAVIANIIRVYIVILIGEATNMQHSLVHDHATLGWILFGIAIFIWIYFSANYIVNHPALVISATVQTPELEAGKVLAARVGIDWNKIILLIVAIAVGPALFTYYSRTTSVPGNIVLVLPEHIRDFEKRSFDDQRWQPVIHGADLTYSATYYSKTMPPISVLVYRYNFQQQDKEAINVNNHLYQKGVWKFLEQRSYSVATQNNSLPIEENLIQDNVGRQRLIFSWYRTFNRDVANRYYAKGLNVLGIVAGDPSISIVILSTNIETDRASAEDRLSMFATSVKTLLANAGF
jgi:EpsI family protein